MRYFCAAMAVMCLGASIYFAIVRHVGFGVLFFIGMLLTMLIGEEYEKEP
jgi:hypothetical protein